MPATPMLGLGLDTARELIAESGAVIEVTHLDLRSCKLEIRFPPDARAPAVEPPAPVRDRAPRPRRVLIVEDDAVLLELTQRMLTRAGHAVVCADCGETALALWEAEGETFALVVTDVVMPRMSGLELASRLLRDRPDLPIVFASGFLQDEVTRASLSLHAPNIAFCDKPFRPEDLIAKVGTLLEGAARSDGAARRGQPAGLPIVK